MSVLNEKSARESLNASAHDCHDLVRLFNKLFSISEQTRLESGGKEPIYLTKSVDNLYNRIVFTHDYFASALHEIAHWGVAGHARRQIQDYGYWYAPDGRTQQQQNEFEQVEVAPQALEWILAAACGHKFRVSADNLTQGLGASETFKDAIFERALLICERGLNHRMNQWVDVLLAFYQPQLQRKTFLSAEYFDRKTL